MMSELTILKIAENSHLMAAAAAWFHEKWEVPLQAYTESMQQCAGTGDAVPQWYVVLDAGKMVAGAGVIENDFHVRKDLTPNLCALYVEEAYRCQGIAGNLLDFICRDMQEKNIGILYLVTDHTAFYERYGWKFLCMVQEEGEESLTRMYVHSGT